MTLREYINSLSDEEFLRFVFPGPYMIPCYLCRLNKGDDCASCDLMESEENCGANCRREVAKSLALPLSTMQETSAYCAKNCKQGEETKNRPE